jgi:hypothetical protein
MFLLLLAKKHQNADDFSLQNVKAAKFLLKQNLKFPFLIKKLFES